MILRPSRRVFPPARRVKFVPLLLVLLLALPAALFAREHEELSVYAGRRARLAATLDAPVVLFGYTGRENSSPSYVFNQEENFYYLTGHNQPGAALLVLPPGAAAKGWKGPPEILFLPLRDPAQERWDGPQIGPRDPNVTRETGFAAVEPFSELEGRLKAAAKIYRQLYTLLPHPRDTGYPHAREWSEWLRKRLPRASLRDAAPAIGAMRQIKSPGEIALLTKAIDLSVDAQLAAMRLVRPGLWEYQVAAKMVEIHQWGGCEGEAYAPIVGAGFHSTILHYNRLRGRIRDGDIVLLDVGCQYSGYAADVTRTLPANGHFTPRQREIYDIVLGAQNAAIDAVKPGMRLNDRGPHSLYNIAYEYLNSHGRDHEGRRLGRYFISGLGHHIGLDVHDAGDPDRPLEPGMVITIEPGLYIPEESLGVRIEDDVLVTPTGHKVLTARLPRDPDTIESIMAAAGARSEPEAQEREK